MTSKDVNQNKVNKFALIDGLENSKTIKMLQLLNSNNAISLCEFKRLFGEDAEKFLSEAGDWIEVDKAKEEIKITAKGKKILEEYLSKDPLAVLLDSEEVLTHRIFDKCDVVDDVALMLVYALGKDENNNLTYLPIIATSDGRLIRVKDKEKELIDEGWKPSEIPKDSRYCYFEVEINGRNYFFKLKDKPSFTDRFKITNISKEGLRMLVEKTKINPKALFDDIVSVIKDYWDHNDPREYYVCASLVILPYIEHFLQHTIYLLLQGKEDTGKSTLQRLLSYLQLYGLFGGKKTLSVLVHYIDFYGVKLGLDEFEKYAKEDKTMLQGVLNSGLYADGTYDKFNKDAKEFKDAIVSLRTFGFKSFSCNELYGFDSSFLSRCYSIICVRQGRDLKNIWDREVVNEDLPKFQEIVDRCFAYCLANWKEILKAIKEEKRKLEEEKLFGRTTDRNSIILGIINHFNPEVYSQVKELLQDKEGLTKKEELETESGALFWVLADLFLEKQKQEQSILIVTNKQLVDIIQEQLGFPDEERTKYAKRVGKLLKRVGLFKKPDQIKRTKEGMVYCIYLRDFEDLLKRFNYIDILNYITSQSAQTSSDGEVSEFCVVMKLNNTEEPKSETLENSQVSKGKTPVPTDKQVILLKEIIRKLKENGENTIERISEKWNEFSQIYDLTDLEKLLVYLKKEGLIFEPRAGYYELL